MRRRAPRALAWLSLPVLVLALVPSALRPSELPFSRDLLDFFLPMKALFARCVQGGHVPWWDPWTLGGQPFFANLQSQVLYPPNWIFAVLDVAWASSLYAVLHLALAGAGALALARALDRSWPASVLAAHAFAAGGFAVSLVELQNQLCSLSWMPWCWLAGLLHGRKPSRRTLAGWAAACAMALLAGEPQLALLAGASSAVLALATGWEAGPILAARRALSGAGLVVVLVACACAVQLVPLAELALRSDRITGDWADDGRHALEPRAVGAILVAPTDARPAPAGPYARSLFMGSLVVVLALGAVLRRSRHALVLAILATASLLLALGSATPVGAAMHAVTPFLRYPLKYFAVAALAMPVLAAEGLDLACSALVARRNSARLVATAAWIAALATSFQLVSAHRRLTPSLSAVALLEPTPAIRLLIAQTAADGPRVHAAPLTRERLEDRAARILAGDLAGAMRERVELLEGGMPAYFSVHATWGGAAMTVRDQAHLLAQADGPLAPDLARRLRAGFVIDSAHRRLPLTELPVDGGTARLYVLPSVADFPAREWTGPNSCVGDRALGPPSSYPGWHEVAPGSWRFRPTGLVPLALVSAATWLILGALAVSRRRGTRGPDDAAPPRAM